MPTVAWWSMRWRSILPRSQAVTDANLGAFVEETIRSMGQDAARRYLEDGPQEGGYLLVEGLAQTVAQHRIRLRWVSPEGRCNRPRDTILENTQAFRSTIRDVVQCVIANS